MRTLESYTGASRLLLQVVSRRHAGECQQRRRERDECNRECDQKRRSAQRTILRRFHGKLGRSLEHFDQRTRSQRAAGSERWSWMFLGLVVWTSPSLTVNLAGGSGGTLGKGPNGLCATRHCGTCPDVVKTFFLRKRAFFALHTAMTKAIPISIHVYEVRPRKDKRGVDLISDALPFGRLWYTGPEAVANAMGQR